jgi:transcriptional regulator NrdR family protein
MECLECGGDTKVIDSRPSKNNRIRRRRECLFCDKRWTTYESIVDTKPLKGIEILHEFKLKDQNYILIVTKEKL